ncbi:MAG TPA: hypothetical protein VE422_49900 [Terriglobia bacterium]|nr:hypothetical protein [Terriglobia bacterium]
MKRRLQTGVVILFALLAASFAQAQTAPAKTAAAPKKWTPPRTADGHPDLQGVWSNNNVTPLERPAALAGKPFLTDVEVAALKAKASDLFSGDGDAAFGDDVFNAIVAGAQKFTSSDVTTGNYNQFWIADRDFDNRTSLITDPPDGRLPPLTLEAQKRRPTPQVDRTQRGTDGPEDRSLSERCITFGAPRIQAAYNSYFQIFQTRDSVAILMETIHDARIIPLDGRPHVGQGIRQWLGDSVGHWENDTLVVDTTNYSSKSDFRGSHQNLHVVERFTRVSPNRIDYEITVNDPTTWTRPWSAMIPLKLSHEEIYEYACHEANEGMVGILSGARTLEKAR